MESQEATKHDIRTKLKEVADVMFASEISYQDSQRLYKQWAESQDNYDKLNINDLYGGPSVMADETAKLFLRPEQKLVLDIGSGTGITGQLLLKKGFRTIHALEPCEEFVLRMEAKRIYQKIFHECIGRGSVVSPPEGTYDAIVASGSFGPGMIPCDALYEIIRLLKPGGYFVNTFRQEYLWTVPEYRDRLEPLVQQLERDGRWRKVKWETYPCHFLNMDGQLMVYQRC